MLSNLYLSTLLNLSTLTVHLRSSTYRISTVLDCLNIFSSLSLPLLRMLKEEVLYDVFTNVKLYGIHHPVSYHAWKSGKNLFLLTRMAMLFQIIHPLYVSWMLYWMFTIPCLVYVDTTVIPLICASCHKVVFPLYSGAWCVKCKIGVHRECCRQYASICSEMSIIDPAFGRKTAAASMGARSSSSVKSTSSTLLALPALISGFIHVNSSAAMPSNRKNNARYTSALTMTVCDSEKWTANLNTIWTNLSVSQSRQGVELPFELNNADYAAAGYVDDTCQVRPFAQIPLSDAHGSIQTDNTVLGGTNTDVEAHSTQLSAEFDYLVADILVRDQKSFLGFTIISLVKLYAINDSADVTCNESGRGGPDREGKGRYASPAVGYSGTSSSNGGYRSPPLPPPWTDDQCLESLRDGRDCLNVSLQAVLLWIDQWCQYSEDYRHNSSTWLMDRKTLVAHCSRRVQCCTAITYGIHENENEWKNLVNAVENAVLRWNDSVLYKQLHKLCCRLTKSKDAQLRVKINRSGPTYGTGSGGQSNAVGVAAANLDTGAVAVSDDLLFNSKFCHLNANFMAIIRLFETIGTAVTPLDKLNILVAVLKQILKDGAAPPNHHVMPVQIPSFDQAAGSRPVSGTSLFPIHAVPPPVAVLDTDQLLQKFIEIIKYSYLSGNGINWYAECEFIYRLMFAGVLTLSCDSPQNLQQSDDSKYVSELDSVSVQRAAQAALIKSSVISVHEDWLLGMEGYALVSLQQGLDSLLFG